MKHKFIQRDNGQVHYFISRCKKPAGVLFFTHGLTADSSMFEKQVDYFKDKYDIVLWDVPCHGLSRPYNNFTYRETADALNDIFIAENIEKAILIGMSMGGYPVQFFRDKYPGKAMGIVGIDTTPIGTGYYSKSDIFWLKQVEWMAACFPVKILKWSMAAAVSATDYSKNTMLNMLNKSSKKDITRQMGIAYGQFIKENRDVKTDCPVLILCGEKDSTGKVKQYCIQWARKTGYPLIFIKGAKHFANGDNPGQVNREIEKFIESVIL